MLGKTCYRRELWFAVGSTWIVHLVQSGEQPCAIQHRFQSSWPFSLHFAWSCVLVVEPVLMLQTDDSRPKRRSFGSLYLRFSAGGSGKFDHLWVCIHCFANFAVLVGTYFESSSGFRLKLFLCCQELLRLWSWQQPLAPEWRRWRWAIWARMGPRWNRQNNSGCEIICWSQCHGFHSHWPLRRRFEKFQIVLISSASICGLNSLCLTFTLAGHSTEGQAQPVWWPAFINPLIAAAYVWSLALWVSVEVVWSSLSFSEAWDQITHLKASDVVCRYARGVQVKLLISKWAHTNGKIAQYLAQLNGTASICSEPVRRCIAQSI